MLPYLQFTDLLIDDDITLDNKFYIPPRIFTLYELENFYNGQNHNPAYVSANGLVFDVTLNPAWQGGTHLMLAPGHDYSQLFTTYHGNNFKDLSLKAPIIGRIIYDT